MSWYDDYEPYEPSEVDEIVREAIEKLEGYIIDNTKLRINDIIDSAQKWETKYNKAMEQQREHFRMLDQKNKEIDELRKELERKRTEFGILPFEVGDEVYCIVEDYSSKVKFNCPRCDGKGRITITQDGVEYKAECPVCHDSIYRSDTNKRESSYAPYKLKSGRITRINLEAVQDPKKKTPVTEAVYRVDETVVPLVHIRNKKPGGSYENEDVINELKKMADELNELAAIGCKVEVGILSKE